MSQFTALEWEIINHRLGAPDAIAECLADAQSTAGEGALVNLYTTEEVEERVGELLDRPDLVNLELILDLEILKECAAGSTFFTDMADAVADGLLSYQKRTAYLKAAESLDLRFDTETPVWGAFR